MKVNECKDKFQSEKLAYQTLDGVLVLVLYLPLASCHMIS